MSIATKAPRAKKDFTILYVDDEQVNLRGFKAVFRRHFNIFVALNGDEALEVLKNEKIDLLITDQMMPGITGTELLEKVHTTNPEIIRMILSGFIKLDELKSATGSFGIHDFVSKPWNFEELKGTFDHLLTTPNAPLRIFHQN